jgi:hypothetical protein
LREGYDFAAHSASRLNPISLGLTDFDSLPKASKPFRFSFELLPATSRSPSKRFLFLPFRAAIHLFSKTCCHVGRKKSGGSAIQRKSATTLSNSAMMGASRHLSSLSTYHGTGLSQRECRVFRADGQP